MYFAVSHAQDISPDYQMFLFSYSQRANMDSLNTSQMSRSQTPTPGRYNLQRGNSEVLTQTERLF